MANKESGLVPIFAMAVLAVYAYSFYYMTMEPKMKNLAALLPPKLRIYGQLKFLTFHCLVWQFMNSILHVLAHYIKPLRPIRDTVFVALTYPLGMIVVLTFWSVWHVMGRELIFPAALSKFYPDWLNHTTHTIALPVNLVFIYLSNHKYGKNFGLLTLAYMLSYTVFLYHIKSLSGNFVYRYMDTMTDLEAYIYFACTGLFAFLTYKSGEYLTKYIHAPCSQRPQVSAGKSASAGSKKQK